MHGRRDGTGFWWESPRDHSENRSIHGREDVIRMDLRETGLEGVEWIQLAQDRGQQRVVVTVVMNLRVLAPQS
jgi:hypothetical protein